MGVRRKGTNDEVDYWYEKLGHALARHLAYRSRCFGICQHSLRADWCPAGCAGDRNGSFVADGALTSKCFVPYINFSE